MFETIAIAAARTAASMVPAAETAPAPIWPWLAATACAAAAAAAVLHAKRHSRHVEVPLLRILLAIGRDEDGWRRVGRLAIRDAKGARIGDFAIDARHDGGGRYAEIRSSRRGERPSHFRALYAGGVLHFTVAELRVLDSLGPRAGRARIAMPLARRAQDHEARADIDIMEMLREAVDEIKRGAREDRRRQGRANAKGSAAQRPEHRGLQEAVSAIRDAGARKQAAAVANQAIAAVGARAAKAARIAAARLLHPDATPAGDADAAAKTRALAAINAILDKAEAA